MLFRERQALRAFETVQRKAEEPESSVDHYRADMRRRIEQVREPQRKARLQAARGRTWTC